MTKYTTVVIQSFGVANGYLQLLAGRWWYQLLPTRYIVVGCPGAFDGHNNVFATASSSTSFRLHHSMNCTSLLLHLFSEPYLD